MRTQFPDRKGKTHTSEFNITQIHIKRLPTEGLISQWIRIIWTIYGNSFEYLTQALDHVISILIGISKLSASDRTTKRLSYFAMFGFVFSAFLFFALTQRNRHSNGAGHSLIRQSLFDLESTGICENMNYKLETRMVWIP